MLGVPRLVEHHQLREPQVEGVDIAVGGVGGGEKIELPLEQPGQRAYERQTARLRRGRPRQGIERSIELLLRHCGYVLFVVGQRAEIWSVRWLSCAGLAGKYCSML